MIYWSKSDTPETENKERAAKAKHGELQINTQIQSISHTCLETSSASFADLA